MKKEEIGKPLSKQTVNIIRTVQRNNIELTAIADGKANVLLSLNALMITFLIPLVATGMDMIIQEYLYIPLMILSLTCFVTIYLSTIVLRPSNFKKVLKELNPDDNFSPFFFGNFYTMPPEEFYSYLKETAGEQTAVKSYLAQDLYYIGRRLGKKMAWIRYAFDIFLIGIFLTLLSTGIVLFCF